MRQWMGAHLLRKTNDIDQVAAATAIFQERLDRVASDMEDLLDRLLAADPLQDERARPPRLLEAMRYATLAGGKRFRPFLVVETANLFAGARSQALMVGSAVEFVHCYSLVHDDLPAMDNDDLRRGRPTTHKAFDEATAILAGDGLLTLAFDVLSREETHPDPGVRVELVAALARGAGLGGMVGGQVLDLAAEGRFTNGVLEPLGQDEIATRFSGRPAGRRGSPSSATAPPSGRRFRSPTTCSTPKAIRPWSARPPIRMRRPTRRPSCAFWGSRARARSLESSSLMRKRPSRRSERRRMC